MKEISIDIVICTYNNAPVLEKTLSAISRQKFSSRIDCRVLVVNNNCTDETPDVVKKFSASAPLSVRMIGEMVQGLTPTRLRGVNSTDAEWIAFVDDDCLLAEDWIEQAACFATEHPECGAFGGQITLDWQAPPPPYVQNHLYAYAGKNRGEKAKRVGWIAGAGMVLRRKALEESGWIEKQFLKDRIGRRLVSGGDMEISMRVAAAHEVWYNPKCKLQHIIPPHRITREYLRRMVFGLGASRHNTLALKWSGSYLTWFFFSLVYSLGFLGFNLIQMFRELLKNQSGFDVLFAINPVRGWWSAMWSMLRMESAVRRQMLGCALVPNKSRN